MRYRYSGIGTMVAVALGAAAVAQAAPIQIDTTALGQVREDQRYRTEVPLNWYVGGSYGAADDRFSADTNLRLFYDAKRSWGDGDLYQAVVHIRPSELLRFDIGRQFLNEGFSSEVADAMKMTIRPPWPVEFVVYSGMPRSVERGDFNRDDGLLSGLTVRFPKIPRTVINLHTAWRKFLTRVTDLRENDSVMVGADASYSFKGSWKPLLYGLFEYSASGKVVETGTGGIDLYPASWLALNAEFNYFDADRSFDRRTILGLFTQGRTLSGRFSSTWTLVPKMLDLIQTYTYQNITVRPGDRRQGHLLEADLPLTFDRIGLTVQPGYYFRQGFGGRVHGVRGTVHEQFTKKFYAEVGADYATYRKVTGENDNAFASGLWTGYEVAKGFTVAAGFEYNRNNLLGRDARGAFKLQYTYGNN